MSRRKPAPAKPSAPAPAQPAQPRRWLKPVVVVLVLAGLGVGLWYGFREPTPGPPPELPAGEIEPAVTNAVNDARQQVLREPRSAEAWGTLGLVFAAHGFREESVACYSAAHRLDRADSRWAYLLGLHHSFIDAAAAVPFLESATAGRHPSPEHEAAARCKLGEQYLAAGRPADAERTFRDQLARTPGHPRATLGLGQALAARGQPAEAVEPLTAASRTPYAGRRAHAQLAAVARARGDEATAAAHERTAAGLPDDPDWPDPFAQAIAARRVSSKAALDEVAALEGDGRLADTIPILERLTRERPTGHVLVKLGNNLVQLNRPADAEKPLREAIKVEPAGVQGHFFLGMSLYFQARAAGTPAPRRDALYREAAETYARAADLKPDYAIAHYYRGLCLKALDDRTGAVEAFRRAVESRPEMPALQLELVEALADAGRTAEAVNQLREAEKVVPPDHPRLPQLRERLGIKP